MAESYNLFLTGSGESTDSTEAYVPLITPTSPLNYNKPTAPVEETYSTPLQVASDQEIAASRERVQTALTNINKLEEENRNLKSSVKMLQDQIVLTAKHRDNSAAELAALKKAGADETSEEFISAKQALDKAEKFAAAYKIAMTEHIQSTNEKLAANTSQLASELSKLSDKEKSSLKTFQGEQAREETERQEAKTAAAAAAATAAREEALKTQLSASFSGKLEGAAGRKRLLAAQQCFLLYNNHFFVNAHKKLLGGTIKYEDRAVEDQPSYNFYSGKKLRGGVLNTSPGYYSKQTESTKIILVNDGSKTNDSTIINKLKTKNKQEEFDNITPAEYAQLVPRLRLFKVNYVDKGDKSKQEIVEFEFNNKIDITDMAAVSKTFEQSIRGDGAGVKSFEWSYLGSDAFTATRDLKATLKLNFQSFHELQKPRKSGGKDYSYLDLVIQADCGDRDSDDKVIYDPGCYEVLAEVGYNVPSNSTMNEDMLEAVRNSVEHLYLVMTDHAFEFEQDGTFSMTINYRARLGSQLSSRKLNVLLPGGGNEGTVPQKKINDLKKEVADAKKSSKNDNDGT